MVKQINPRNANGTYTRELLIPAQGGVVPTIHRIAACSNVQIGFAFFDAAEGGNALADGAVFWGHPQGGPLTFEADIGHLVEGSEGGAVYVENRTLGYLTIHVE